MVIDEKIDQNLKCISDQISALESGVEKIKGTLHIFFQIDGDEYKNIKQEDYSKTVLKVRSWVQSSTVQDIEHTTTASKSTILTGTSSFL